ncbi:MAG: hypothetical protein AB7K24_26445 [Gemmataceae bacterium]
MLAALSALPVVLSSGSSQTAITTEWDGVIESQQRYLANVTDPAARAVLEEHIDAAQKLRHAQVEGRRSTLSGSQPAASPPPVPVDTPVVAPPDGGRVVEWISPFLPSQQFVQESNWVRSLGNGSELAVWAGHVGADPTQGVVLVTRFDLGKGPTVLAKYFAAERRGGLRVVSAVQNIVHVVGTNGASFEIDADHPEIVPVGLTKVP